jgi:hypothetical protein
MNYSIASKRAESIYVTSLASGSVFLARPNRASAGLTHAYAPGGPATLCGLGLAGLAPFPDLDFVRSSLVGPRCVTCAKAATPNS